MTSAGVQCRPVPGRPGWRTPAAASRRARRSPPAVRRAAHGRAPISCPCWRSRPSFSLSAVTSERSATSVPSGRRWVTSRIQPPATVRLTRSNSGSSCSSSRSPDPGPRLAPSLRRPPRPAPRPRTAPPAARAMVMSLSATSPRTRCRRRASPGWRGSAVGAVIDRTARPDRIQQVLRRGGACVRRRGFGHDPFDSAGAPIWAPAGEGDARCPAPARRGGWRSDCRRRQEGADHDRKLGRQLLPPHRYDEGGAAGPGDSGPSRRSRKRGSGARARSCPRGPRTSPISSPRGPRPRSPTGRKSLQKASLTARVTHLAALDVGRRFLRPDRVAGASKEKIVSYVSHAGAFPHVDG